MSTTLTSSQLTSLKTAILADPNFTASIAIKDWPAIANGLNVQFSPTWYVWRSSITRDQITTGSFDFTQVDNLTVGQARIFDWLFQNQALAMNPSDPGKRAAINACWTGTAGKTAVGTYILSLCYRPALYGEKILSSGTGTTASPATMGFEGSIQAGDVQAAMS